MDNEERFISAKEAAEAEARVTQLIHTKNKAASIIVDAKARYIKDKTRAKSRKAALERDAAINAPRFKVLDDYERKQDIIEAYGWALSPRANATNYRIYGMSARNCVNRLTTAVSIPTW